MQKKVSWFHRRLGKHLRSACVPKRSFWFRANEPLPNAHDTYCRFSMSEETYGSVDDARHRLATLHDAFPRALGGPEDDEYTRTMRTGFRVGTVTYILETDGAIFWDEVQRLTKTLAQSTPSAELTRAIINAPGNKSLDASGGSAARNLLGAAQGALIRAAALTQPLAAVNDSFSSDES